LKGEIAIIAKQIQTQLSSIQILSPFLLYAEVTCILPNSWPSNIYILISIAIMLLRITDILYCIIDILRVRQEDKSKAYPGAIRKAIEEEIYTIEGQEKWHYTTIIRDRKNTEYIRIIYRDKAEL
jgi:hypothetical protein